MMRIERTIVIIALLLLAGCSHHPTSNARAPLPIFDAHLHYSQLAWDPYPMESVIELMDRAGVAMALLSSTPDEGTLRLYDYAPNRIVPELRPYHGKADSYSWIKTAGMLDYLKERIAAHPHRGIGEFHIHRIDPRDRDLLAGVAALAKAHGAVIHLHAKADVVDLFYELEPALTLIWAHAGMIDPPEVVDRTMARYPTLYADSSYREDEILDEESGLITPVWRDILIRHADRFMVGSDTWDNNQWDEYEMLIATHRRWLSQLPSEVAEKIAYRNAERLFGVKVDPALIGAR